MSRSMKSTRLLAAVLSVPMLCSLTFANDIKTYAEEDVVATTTNVATTEPAESTVVSPTSTVVEMTASSTNATKTTTATTTTTASTAPKWDGKSNFPDENGELRFWMDDLDETKPISIKLVYTTEDTDKPISGAQVSAYKIASLTVKYGDAKYTLLEELQKDFPGLDFSILPSEEFDKVAEMFAAKDLKVAAEATTDENGMCMLENLEPGLYLIREKAKIGMAKDYEYFKSFILNAPFPMTEDDKYNGQWLYTVEALPKTELTSKKKLILTPPQTGDNTNEDHLKYSAIVFGLSAVTAAGAIWVIAKRKNKKVENEENK